jgi:hypothetical protein
MYLALALATLCKCIKVIEAYAMCFFEHGFWCGAGGDVGLPIAQQLLGASVALPG